MVSDRFLSFVDRTSHQLDQLRFVRHFVNTLHRTALVCSEKDLRIKFVSGRQVSPTKNFCA
jgi:hypothetical protein